MLVRRIAAAVALSTSLFQCASPDGATGTVVAPVTGGQTDTTTTNVVGIVIHTSQGIAMCTGSLILPNLVLTARHCVSELSTQYFACEAFTDPSSGQMLDTTTAGAPFAARNFQVTTDTEIGFGSTFVGVSEVLIPPGSTGSALCGKDIAMLRLSSNITDVGLRTPRLDLAPTNGEMFTAVGYGAINGANQGAGTRRIRSGLQIQFVGAYAQRGINFTAMSEWLGDTGTCEGDSGGPALDEVGQVIGSVSRGGANTCDGPIYTRVDSFAEWIRSEARDAAAAGGNDLPAWIDPPASNTANFGDPCRSNDECVQPLSCLPIDGQLRCTDTGCECPDAWICGTAGGYPACVPDPNAPPDAGPTATDASTTTDGGTTADSGTGTGHGGCSAAPSRGSNPTRAPFALVACAAVAVAVARRRRA